MLKRLEIVGFKVGGILVVALLVPQAALAGPICSGFSCTMLVIAFLGPQLIAMAGVMLLVVFLASKLFKFSLSKFAWVSLFLCFIVASYFAYGLLQQGLGNNRHQTRNEALAQKVNFDLYEPSYVASGYQLDHSEIYESLGLFSAELERDEMYLMFEYYDPTSPSTQYEWHTRWYSVVSQSVHKRVSPDTIGYPTVLASTTQGTTDITVLGTISKAEAQKVLSSIKKVSAPDIRFYTGNPELAP